MSTLHSAGCYVGLREPPGAMVTRPDGSPFRWRHRWRCGGTRRPGSSGDSAAPDQRSSPWRCCSTIPALGSWPNPTCQRFNFKADVVARWRGNTWALDPREIDAWLSVATAWTLPVPPAVPTTPETTE